jgi:hypothetical protein
VGKGPQALKVGYFGRVASKRVWLVLLGACGRGSTGEAPPPPCPSSVAAADASTVAEVGPPPVAFSDAAREPVAPIPCASPSSIKRIGEVPTGPAVQWLGETVVDGHTMTMWDGATLKPADAGAVSGGPRPAPRWKVVQRQGNFFVDVYDHDSGALVGTPTRLRDATSFSNLAIDEQGRVWNLATRTFTNAEPLTCHSPRTDALPPRDAAAPDWWVTIPSYWLSPQERFEECNVNGLALSVRHLLSGVVTSLEDGRLRFAPDDRYALVEPSSNKDGTRTTLDKVTWDAAGSAHTKTIGSHASTAAAGQMAYAVATQARLTVTRACDDAVIGTVRIARADTDSLTFSESGALLLHKTSSTATVYQLR